MMFCMFAGWRWREERAPVQDPGDRGVGHRQDVHHQTLCPSVLLTTLPSNCILLHPALSMDNGVGWGRKGVQMGMREGPRRRDGGRGGRGKVVLREGEGGRRGEIVLREGEGLVSGTRIQHCHLTSGGWEWREEVQMDVREGPR